MLCSLPLSFGFVHIIGLLTSSKVSPIPHRNFPPLVAATWIRQYYGCWTLPFLDSSALEDATINFVLYKYPFIVVVVVVVVAAAAAAAAAFDPTLKGW